VLSTGSVQLFFVTPRPLAQTHPGLFDAPEDATSGRSGPGGISRGASGVADAGAVATAAWQVAKGSCALETALEHCF